MHVPAHAPNVAFAAPSLSQCTLDTHPVAMMLGAALVVAGAIIISASLIRRRVAQRFKARRHALLAAAAKAQAAAAAPTDVLPCVAAYLARVLAGAGDAR